jgi:hypothetical protein
MTEQQATGGNFTRHVAKKALAPIVTAAATAITAYLMRKAAEAWKEHVEPKLEERGGGKAVATDALESVRERIPDGASEKLDELSSKVGSGGGEGSSEEPAKAADSDRATERRKREQRRKQRRTALDKAGSS